MLQSDIEKLSISELKILKNLLDTNLIFNSTISLDYLKDLIKFYNIGLMFANKKDLIGSDILSEDFFKILNELGFNKENEISNWYVTKYKESQIKQANDFIYEKHVNKPSYLLKQNLPNHEFFNKAVQIQYILINELSENKKELLNANEVEMRDINQNLNISNLNETKEKINIENHLSKSDILKENIKNMISEVLNMEIYKKLSFSFGDEDVESKFNAALKSLGNNYSEKDLEILEKNISLKYKAYKELSNLIVSSQAVKSEIINFKSQAEKELKNLIIKALKGDKK